MKIRRVNDVAVIAPHGWMMGGDETEEFENTMRQVFAEGGRNLVVNMAGVQMMNSTAISVLTGCRESYTKGGGRIALCGVDTRLDHILVITKLTMLFDVYPSEREAVESFMQPA